MIPVPSHRFILLFGVCVVASLAILAFPEALLLLLATLVVLLGAALLDLVITPSARSLTVERLVVDPMSVLRPESITLLVRNQSSLALAVRIRDTLPLSFQTETPEVTGRIVGKGELRLAYQIQPIARGQFSWGAIHLRLRSVLGLWEKRNLLEGMATSRVYPNVSELHRYHLLARTNRLDAMGIRKVRLRGGAWEFESLRDYVPGDDVRKLDWKATARRRKLIVRNHQAERNQTLLLLIDSGRLMTAEVDGTAKLDHAINAALVLAHVSLSRGDRVGLCAFSHKVHKWVSPRSHVAQNRLLTDALYDLKGDFTETDHGRALRTVAARHSKRALLVVLTDFVDAQTAQEMVAHLHLAARRHLVLFVALKDPFLDRAARSHPHTPQDGFRKAAALDLLHERSTVLEDLRMAGMLVADVEPKGITAPLLNHYLQATTRGLL